MSVMVSHLHKEGFILADSIKDIIGGEVSWQQELKADDSVASQSKTAL